MLLRTAAPFPEIGSSSTRKFPARFSLLIPSLLAILGCLSCPPVCSAQDLRPAEALLLQGRADQATSQLRTILARNPGQGAAHLLLCRVFLSTLHGSEAAAECQLALKDGLDRNAAAQDWAGRAFGLEAEHAGPITGMKLANQVHAAFEAAYHLDMRSPAAANDLGEYFVHAPFIVGGGTEKASSLAGSLENTLPEIAHRLRALIAEKHGNAALAEREFLSATQVTQSAGSLVDLATFYTRQGDVARAAGTARRAVQTNRGLDANMVDAAGALDDAHQTALAVQVLHNYLEHGQQSDQAPAFRAHTMLGDMLTRQGDRANARKEFAAALALAANYAPAQKGLGSL